MLILEQITGKEDKITFWLISPTPEVEINSPNPIAATYGIEWILEKTLHWYKTFEKGVRSIEKPSGCDQPWHVITKKIHEIGTVLSEL